MLIIPAAYDYLDYLGTYDGRPYFAVSSNDYYALADDHGNLLTDAMWDSMSSINEGLIRVKPMAPTASLIARVRQ